MTQVITLAALARDILFDVDVYSTSFVNSFHDWDRLARDLSIELKVAWGFALPSRGGRSLVRDVGD